MGGFFCFKGNQIGNQKIVNCFKTLEYQYFRQKKDDPTSYNMCITLKRLGTR